MKLLFDQNLSHRLVELLPAQFVASAHVRHFGLARSSDPDVWDHAKANDYMIVSKETDFQQRALLYGHPPKGIWSRFGNCSTISVAILLRSCTEEIAEFAANPTAAFLALP